MVTRGGTLFLPKIHICNAVVTEDLGALVSTLYVEMLYFQPEDMLRAQAMRRFSKATIAAGNVLVPGMLSHWPDNIRSFVSFNSSNIENVLRTRSLRTLCN